MNKVVEWLVMMLLSKLDAKLAAEALVAVLRASILAIKDVAAKTATPLDDAVVSKAADIVEDIAKMLKVP